MRYRKKKYMIIIIEVHNVKEQVTIINQHVTTDVGTPQEESTWLPRNSISRTWTSSAEGLINDSYPFALKSNNLLFGT